MAFRHSERRSRTGGGAIRFSDDPTAWFGIVPRTFTRRPSAFAGEKRGRMQAAVAQAAAVHRSSEDYRYEHSWHRLHADGLVPCIVQDADTLEVLMMAVDERGVACAHARARRDGVLGAAAAGSYGTRAPPRATCRSSWSCVTTAMPTRCSRSFIRRVRPAIPASAPASTARSPASRLSLGTLSAARPEDSAYVEPLHHRGCEDADRAS